MKTLLIALALTGAVAATASAQTTQNGSRSNGTMQQNDGSMSDRKDRKTMQKDRKMDKKTDKKMNKGMHNGTNGSMDHGSMNNGSMNNGGTSTNGNSTGGSMNNSGR